MTRSFFAAACILAAGVSTAATVSYDFDTNQSASFTTQVGGDAGESTALFDFDYSTHAQNGGINVPIPAAPGSTGTTRGLQLQANAGPGATALDSVAVFPDVAGLNVADGEWQMTFDVWANFNGDGAGGSGTTMASYWGAAADDSALPVISGNVDGFVFGLTIDGGSAADARYGEGNPAAFNHAKANFWGANAQNNSATAWADFFKNDGTNGTAPTGAALAGAPAKQWVTVRVTVTNGGADRTLELKRSGDASFTTVSTISGGTGAFARPVVGFADTNGGPCTANCDDNFVVIDNLVIDDLNQTNVADWMLHI